MHVRGGIGCAKMGGCTQNSCAPEAKPDIRCSLARALPVCAPIFELAGLTTVRRDRGDGEGRLKRSNGRHCREPDSRRRRDRGLGSGEREWTFHVGVQTGGPALSPRFRMEANRIDREAALAISQNCCSRIFPAGPGGCLVGIGEWLSMPPSVVGLPSFRGPMVHVTRPRTC